MELTRREFGRVAALAAAARAMEGQESPRRLRYCIVALGRISMQHFMPACRQSAASRVTAIVSGHRDKAERMAAEYGVAAKNIYNYGNYDEIAHNSEIDAVYIALPNSMHAEYTIRAARAGKHVLCEKPMATKVADAREMVDACRKAGRKLMIAYRCQLEPVNLRAIELIRQGTLGKLQSIESSHGFNIAPGEWRLDGVLGGGGPLMDVGIYSLNACRYLSGEEPAQFKAESSVIDRDGRFTQVEENLAWTTKFPSGVVAACNTSYGGSMPGYFRVHGSKGVMHVESAFGYDGQRLTASVQGGPAIELAPHLKDPSQFVAEADHFAECVFQNKEPKAPGEEGLRDMRYMDAIYKSCGLKGL